MVFLSLLCTTVPGAGERVMAYDQPCWVHKTILVCVGVLIPLTSYSVFKQFWIGLTRIGQVTTGALVPLRIAGTV